MRDSLSGLYWVDQVKDVIQGSALVQERDYDGLNSGITVGIETRAPISEIFRNLSLPDLVSVWS